ncbi:MAG: AraC family transcriptional regulator [Pseudomonas sp.]|nr:AraC family transcriptional regulator [Pseudomonas sp.]
MKTVAVILFPDFLLLDMAGPIEVFSIANRYLDPADRYQVSTVGTVSGMIRASSGVAVQPDVQIHDSPGEFDLLLVPGGPGAYNDAHTDLLPWLKTSAQLSRRYGSICTGAFILGHAGLLDGHRVTTHWHYIDRLISRCPKALVSSDQIYIHDGKLITSGGVTAGIDLALSVVAEDHGKKVALDVAKVLLVVMTRQGGQAQFSPLVAAVATQQSPITQVQNYVLEHLDEEFSIEGLASLAAMSSRHFARVFAREVKMTPMEFIQSARIDRARSLLETTDFPCKTVAHRSGFGSVRHMRFLFGERLGLTPSQYRKQFG